MANICYTEINIFEYDKERATKLYEMILEATRESRDLKELVDAYDLSNNYARGEISFIQMQDKYTIVIATETAWTPSVGLWLELIDKIGIGQEILYYAEEFGCGILQTNNANYIDMYYVDSESSELDTMECVSESDLRRILCDLLKVKDKSLNDLLEDLSEDEKYSELVFIHKWEYIPLTEWC